MEKKKVGIVMDAYKVPKFKDELIKAGWPDIEVTPYEKQPLSLSVLTIFAEEKDVPKVKQIIEQLTIFFSVNQN